jgi:hypothetical protein
MRVLRTARGRSSQERLASALAGLPVMWVGVRCDPEVAAAREHSRSDRVGGMARLQAAGTRGRRLPPGRGHHCRRHRRLCKDYRFSPVNPRRLTGNRWSRQLQLRQGAIKIALDPESNCFGVFSMVHMIGFCLSPSNCLIKLDRVLQLHTSNACYLRVALDSTIKLINCMRRGIMIICALR